MCPDGGGEARERLWNEAPKLEGHAHLVNALAGFEKKNYVQYNLSPCLPELGGPGDNGVCAPRREIARRSGPPAAPPDRSSIGALPAGRGQLPERGGSYREIRPSTGASFLLARAPGEPSQQRPPAWMAGGGSVAPSRTRFCSSRTGTGGEQRCHAPDSRSLECCHSALSSVRTDTPCLAASDRQASRAQPKKLPNRTRGH